jgi:hypothetical protein
MKISDITQRSQVQHIAEDREKLDEGFWIPAIAAGGAVYAGYEGWSNYQAYKRGEIDGAELALRVGTDLALALIGGGAGALIKGGGKLAYRGAKKALGFGDDTAAAAETVRKAKNALAKAEKLKKDIKPGSLAKKRKIVAKKQIKDKKADLKHAKKNLGPSKLARTGGASIGAGVALATKDINPLHDKVYTALGGDLEARDKAEKEAEAAAKEKADKKPKKMPRDFLGPGIVGQQLYDKYEKMKKDKGLK